MESYVIILGLKINDILYYFHDSHCFANCNGSIINIKKKNKNKIKIFQLLYNYSHATKIWIICSNYCCLHKTIQQVFYVSM